MSVGSMPAYQLACQAGGRLAYDSERAAFVVAGLPEGITLAGSAALGRQ